MKIRVTRGRRSVKLRFRAEGKREAEDLKDIVMGLAKSSNIMPALDLLAKRGYVSTLAKETRNTREYDLTRKAGGD